ncbi:hypothetical protein CBS147353_11411 [Aspergillus niger]|nr:hypothetical protein CBS147353_11411 [Aspergillus niger]
MSAGFDTLKALLSRMREDGKFSDLMSPFFDKAANGNFEESESRVINIHDDPFIVSKLFDFLYRADYDDSPDDTDGPAADNESAANEEGISPTERISQDALSRQWRRAQTNVQIYIIADKYLQYGTCLAARNRTVRSVSRHQSRRAHGRDALFPWDNRHAFGFTHTPSQRLWKTMAMRELLFRVLASHTAVAIEVEERRTPMFLSQHLEGSSVIVYRLNGTGFLLLPMEPGCNRYGSFSWSYNSTAPFVGPQSVAQLSCMTPPEKAVVAAFPCVTEGKGRGLEAGF